jgi:(S)-2-hydroxyglutarate dehydrogenase
VAALRAARIVGEILQASERFDVVVIGGGILGVTISYWLSQLYDCSIVLVEKEFEIAKHASSRNTGLLHRPFYLNPEKKKVFSRAAQKSYFLWKDLASKYELPFSPIGTLEVALDEAQVNTLRQYKEWALKNGVEESEVELLDSAQVQKLEPQVKCAGAIFSKTDTSVDYGSFTNFLFSIAAKNGVKFFTGSKVKKINETGQDVQFQLQGYDGSHREISAKYLINAAGGSSVDLAHRLGLAKEYTDLHFRGEYWKVDEPFASKIMRNIYSVARYKEFPFLDPHFVIRTNGVRQIGPNATLVSGPEAYKGLSETRFQLVSKIFERPIRPKLSLFTNGMFLSLVWHEWRSSISKKAMCDRVKEFIPSIEVAYLNERGLAGVRSSLIDRNGFVPEALLIEGKQSLHILNYNSPGATGAPAFSAYVVSRVMKEGHFDGLKKKPISSQDQLWKFDDASDL